TGARARAGEEDGGAIRLRVRRVERFVDGVVGDGGLVALHDRVVRIDARAGGQAIDGIPLLTGRSDGVVVGDGAVPNRDGSAVREDACAQRSRLGGVVEEGAEAGAKVPAAADSGVGTEGAASEDYGPEVVEDGAAHAGASAAVDFGRSTTD